jgi:hypothetical protein
VAEQPAAPAFAVPSDTASPAATQPAVALAGVSTAADVASRKIIRNGTVEFEVRSFDDTYQTVSSVVGEEGGFVASTSSEKLANGKVRGTIVVRVAPDRLDRFLLKLRALGELKSQQIGSADVTKQYTDIESELRGLRTMETRLIDLIKTGKGEVKDLVEAEKQLGEYRVRIEKLEGEIRYYNNLVAMATLTITAYEKDIQKPTAAAEQEAVNLSLQTEEVEAKYAAARTILTEAGGRIVEAQLKNADAEHVSATITADLPPAKADYVVGQLRQLGVAARYSRDRRQTTAGGTGAPTAGTQVEQKDTRITLALFNLANLAPRETAVLTVAVRDVEATYRRAQALIRAQAAPAAPAPAAETQPAVARAVGRVVSSNLNGQQADRQTADLRAELRADAAVAGQADALVQAIRDAGEVLSSTLAENPDTANTTAAKRGLQVRLVSAASVPARESQSVSLVADDGGVPAAFGRLLAGLKPLTDAGAARIVVSRLNQSDPRTVTGALTFEVRREALPAVDKLFADAGVDVLTRSVNRSTDANTLDSKVLIEVENLQSAESLDPRRTFAMTLEVDDVEKAVEAVRGGIDPAAAGGGAVKEVDFATAREPSGRVTARLTLDARTAATGALLSRIRGLGGTERDAKVAKNAQVPDSRFAKDRIALTLVSRAAIVQRDQGLAASGRAALSSAAAALLYSVYLVVTGLLFILPFALILWPLWRLTRRRKVA